jgi:hypothetical protein
MKLLTTHLIHPVALIAFHGSLAWWRTQSSLWGVQFWGTVSAEQAILNHHSSRHCTLQASHLITISQCPIHPIGVTCTVLYSTGKHGATSRVAFPSTTARLLCVFPNSPGAGVGERAHGEGDLCRDVAFNPAYTGKITHCFFICSSRACIAQRDCLESHRPLGGSYWPISVIQPISAASYLHLGPCGTPVDRLPLSLASQQIVGDFALQRTGCPV